MTPSCMVESDDASDEPADCVCCPYVKAVNPKCRQISTSLRRYFIQHDSESISLK